jgi:hypothetical protein
VGHVPKSYQGVDQSCDWSVVSTATKTESLVAATTGAAVEAMIVQSETPHVGSKPIPQPRQVVCVVPRVSALSKRARAIATVTVTLALMVSNNNNNRNCIFVHGAQAATASSDFSVGECLVTLGRHDLDFNGHLNATEFTLAARFGLYDGTNCSLINNHDSTSSVSNFELLTVYWGGIFLQAACVCQEYDENLSCCNVAPIVYRPGHYNSSQYTYDVCAILKQAKALQCDAIRTEKDPNDDAIWTNVPTAAPMAWIIAAPTVVPTVQVTSTTTTTTTGNNNGPTDAVNSNTMSPILTIPNVSTRSDEAQREEKDPWLVAVLVIGSVTGATLLGLALLLVWNRLPFNQSYTDDDDNHEAVTVAKGSVSHRHVIVEASCTAPDDDDNNDFDAAAAAPEQSPPRDLVVETNGPERAKAPHNDDNDDIDVISPHGDIHWLYPPTYTTNTNTTTTAAATTSTKATTTARKTSMTDLLFDSSMMWRQRFPKTSPKKSAPSGFHVFQDEESSSESSVASDSSDSHDGFGSASSHLSSASSASTTATMDGIQALGAVTTANAATANPTTVAALRSISLMSTRDLEP